MQNIFKIISAFVALSMISAPLTIHATVINDDGPQNLGEVTIVATKIICPNESDLPNWGDGSAPNIEASTASDWLAEHPQCKAVPNWYFEWAPSDAPDAGPTLTGPAGGMYTSFLSPTDENGVTTQSVDLNLTGDRIWLREVLKEGYIPFTGQNTNEDVSAEFYCHNDGLNYDNYDFIGSPQADTTYYCIGFNVKKPIVNICPTPITFPDGSVKIPGVSPEPTVQSILDTNGYSIDVNLDQSLFQRWDIPANKQVKIDTDIIAKHSAYQMSLGFYENENLASLPSYLSPTPEAPLSVPGITYTGTTSPLTTSIGFAISAGNGSTENKYASQISLNADSFNHALVFNTAPDTYVFAFEDLYSGGDGDYNDVIAEVKLSCEDTVPEVPQQCLVVSDEDTKVIETKIGENPTLFTDVNATLVDTNTSIINQYWTADDVITSPAEWIWDTAVETDTSVDKYVTFKRTFTVSDPNTTATLMVGADNSYDVYLDSTSTLPLLSEIDESNHTAEAVMTMTTPILSVGVHTLFFVVKNWALPDQSADNNPAGLLFKLKLNNATCDNNEQDSYVNINKEATYDSETGEITYILNYSFNVGYPASNQPVITDTIPSGTTLVPESISPNGTINEDTLTWTIAGSSGAGSVWFKVKPLEVCSVTNTAMITMLNPNSPNDPQSASSTITTTLPCSTVEICKIDQNENPLSGWTLMLYGEKIEDIIVNSNNPAGINSAYPLLANVSYLATTSGTWNNQNGANPVDAEYSTVDGWSNYMDGYTGYPDDILELQINSLSGAWGAYNSSHSYAQSFIPGTAGSVNFRIFDGESDVQNESWFEDNNGSLDVSLSRGYAGITGENGCVSFSNVPHGTYTVGEIMQDNWMNVSGLETVEINSENTDFVIVNSDQNDEETPDRPTVTLSPNPSSIVLGSTSLLTWSSTDATSCTKSDAWSGSTTTSGVLIVNPIVTSTYSIECTGAGGTAISSTIITVTNPQNPAQCADGIDNDDDLFTDGSDAGCHTDGNALNPESYNEFDDDETNEENSGPENNPPGIDSPSNPSVSFTTRSRSGGGGGGSFTTPSVLGAFTGPTVLEESTCGMYLLEYIKTNHKNNPEEVKKLQTFLNEWIGANIPVTGEYGPLTYNAVKNFQLKYSDEILDPWIKVGLHKDSKKATGYVYRTTQRMINNLMCPRLNLPFPDLTNEIARLSR